MRLKASVAGDMTRQTRRSAVASSLILTQLLCHDGRCVAFLQQQPHCSRVDANKISAPISLQALSNGEKAEEREMIVGSSFVVDQNDAYVYNNMHLSEETPIISAKNSSLVMVLEEEEEHCYILRSNKSVRYAVVASAMVGVIGLLGTVTLQGKADKNKQR